MVAHKDKGTHKVCTKMRIHNSSIRTNRTDWLINQAQTLVKFSKETNVASLLIYACLEARIALEKADLDLVLASIPEADRMEIIELSKPKNGITKQGKRIGALKERYQLFIVAVYKAMGLETNYYDFKKSKILQDTLSVYIHSYYFYERTMTAESLELQPIPGLIKEVEDFLIKSFYVEGDGYAIRSLELNTIPIEDKVLLDEWKNQNIKDEDELIEKLRRNKEARIKN